MKEKKVLFISQRERVILSKRKKKMTRITSLLSLLFFIFIAIHLDGDNRRANGAMIGPIKPVILKAWDEFQKSYNKNYLSLKELESRLQIFVSNYERIVQHNEEFTKGLQTYTMAVNKFADMVILYFIQIKNCI